MIDYYKLLEVRSDASQEVIEKAYKALSMKHHPDRQLPDRQIESTEMMKRLNEAYATLSNPLKREEYDNWRVRFYLKSWWEGGLVKLVQLWLE